MTLDEYQELAKSTAEYPSEKAFEYLATGLAAEAGEVAGIISKRIRGDHIGKGIYHEAYFGNLAKELGDVLWFVSQLATEMDLDLRAVAEINLAKLKDRQSRGMIKGSGDNR